MNDSQLYIQNQKVIHNEHIFKRHFANIGELAFSSNFRIAEREIDNQLVDLNLV